MRALETKSAAHRALPSKIMESFQLEKTVKIIGSNHDVQAELKIQSRQIQQAGCGQERSTGDHTVLGGRD